MVSLISTNDVENEIGFWRVVLGRVVYKNGFSIDRITQDVDEHFVALETYVDDIIKVKLRDAHIKAETFFDLLAMMLTNYNNWVLSSKEYNADIENRYIDILYYLTCDVIIGFNRVILSLNKRITKTDKISHKEVAKILSNELRSKKVYSLTKSTELNLAISSVDYTGDIIYPKITSILEDQSRGNGVKRNPKPVIPEAAKTLKGGDLGFGSLLFLTKNLPSPRFKMNIFMDYNVVSGKISYPEDVKRALERLNGLLQGIRHNTNIIDSELDNGGIDAGDL